MDEEQRARRKAALASIVGLYKSRPPTEPKTMPQMSVQEMLLYLANIVVESDNSGRCDHCATGYCYGSHENDCAIMVAKAVVNGEYKFEEKE